MSPVAPMDLHESYRRSARRLRARHRGNPARLQRSLRLLAACTDAVPHPQTPSPAAQFARMVGDGLNGPVLRYSQRLALLDHAARLGIVRFEANLIIATVQHRRGAGTTVEATRPAASIWRGLVVAGCCQAVILLLAWWGLR
jgi:hypothetical protein